VDKGKDSVKKDPRLLYTMDEKGSITRLLPKNDNANYLWIQYFYGYLKPPSSGSGGGRAGFVMASSASDAGYSEKDIREKLVRTGAVDVMIAIGNNFFYTRSLPCTLWFFDRAKEQDEHQMDRVLMLDARKIYRKVTSKVNDFSPEQSQNLICIVNLYRGNTRKFESTVRGYLETSARLAKETAESCAELMAHFQKVHKTVLDFAVAYVKENKDAQNIYEAFALEDAESLYKQQDILIHEAEKAKPEASSLESIAHLCKTSRKPQDKLIKQLLDAIVVTAKEFQLNKSSDWKALNLKPMLDQLKAFQQKLSGNPLEDEPGLLNETEYFWKQAYWLQSRFPDGVYTDVEGLCKVVNQAGIECKDWSLSPGRYVGVDAAMDDDFNYEERLTEIHIELDGLNEEAFELAKVISDNFKEFAI
ncbi:N-6 DNA methylase, partial [Candidatus Nomurabacteria bacterium]|nr:N-6 DNA methylase [Candidatus Nomurabacteria bacterium]